MVSSVLTSKLTKSRYCKFLATLQRSSLTFQQIPSKRASNVTQRFGNVLVDDPKSASNVTQMFRNVLVNDSKHASNGTQRFQNVFVDDPKPITNVTSRCQNVLVDVPKCASNVTLQLCKYVGLYHQSNRTSLIKFRKKIRICSFFFFTLVILNKY